MKIICSKSELFKGVNTVLKAVPTRTTMTILQCILIDASSDRITLTATDMELGIRTTITGTILSPGMIALEAKLFSEIIRRLPESDVTIESNENLNTLITCEKSKFHIMGQSGREFSELPPVEMKNPAVISQLSLKDVIRQTIFSVSSSDTLPMMTGELFDMSENFFRVVSLDGHRVSIRDLQLKEPCRPVRAVVPGKTLSEIFKILPGEADRQVNIFSTSKHILFAFEDTIVVSRLIDGNYYSIETMIPKNWRTKITINKRDLLECMDRSTLLVSEGDKKPIILNIYDEFMELKINSQIGSMDEVIAIDKEGSDLTIGFNPRYLMDTLRVIDDETVEIFYVDSRSPCVIRNEERTYLYMILPVNFVS